MQMYLFVKHMFRWRALHHSGELDFISIFQFKSGIDPCWPRHWLVNGSPMNQITEFSNSESGRLFSHDKADSIHEVALSCDDNNKTILFTTISKRLAIHKNYTRAIWNNNSWKVFQGPNASKAPIAFEVFHGNVLENTFCFRHFHKNGQTFSSW